jgi:nucleotide-binding universal stress UspA family protein
MSWKPIVVGVDASPSAAAAAALGWKLAGIARTSCHFVHAVADGGLPLAAPGSEVLDAMDSAMVELARRRVRAALRKKLPAAALEHLVVRFGHPTPVLQAEVARLGAELVILGSKRHSALGRWVGGSTVVAAARRLDVPVLVTQGAPTELCRILVAVDASFATKPTIAVAARLTRLVGGQLRAIHALEPLPIVPEMPLLLDPEEVRSQTLAQLERSVWPLLRIPRTMKVTRPGPAGLALADEVAGWGADLLVVGKHGRGWVDRLLLGSVTEGLLSHLPTSLLVVPVPTPRTVAPRRPRLARARGRSRSTV